MNQLDSLPAGINGLLSLAIMFVCICRLNLIGRRVLRRVGVQYVLLLMGAAANGASPWLLEFPGWPSVAFAAAVLFMLCADSFQWRRGAPRSSIKPAEAEQ